MNLIKDAKVRSYLLTYGLAPFVLVSTLFLFVSFSPFPTGFQLIAGSETPIDFTGTKEIDHSRMSHYENSRVGNRWRQDIEESSISRCQESVTIMERRRDSITRVKGCLDRSAAICVSDFRFYLLFIRKRMQR